MKFKIFSDISKSWVDTHEIIEINREAHRPWEVVSFNKKIIERKGIWAGAPKSFLVADNFSITAISPKGWLDSFESEALASRINRIKP